MAPGWPLWPAGDDFRVPYRSNWEMSVVEESGSGQQQRVVSAARRGGESAFRELIAPWQLELQAHCYRMLASAPESEDVVQEVLLRAWRGLARFEERSSLRTWLYRIANNACLDAIERRSKRVLPVEYGASDERRGPEADPLWIGPYPDELLGVEDAHAEPHARYEQRESIELAFVAALQHLSARQRTALLMRDVLGFSARECAETLETTTAAVNSALQHARARLSERLPERSQQVTLRSLGDERVRDLATRYSQALEQGDVDAMVTLLTEDATWSMPPTERWYRGREAIVEFLVAEPFSLRWRHLPARANGQLAFGWYRCDERRGTYVAEVLEVLTLQGERVPAVTAFIGGDSFARCGLPDGR
jgi:RNA polymerase sigma-70 factor (ECF subfamily)